MVKKKKKEQMQQWDSPQHLAGQRQRHLLIETLVI